MPSWESCNLPTFTRDWRSASRPVAKNDEPCAVMVFKTGMTITAHKVTGAPIVFDNSSPGRQANRRDLHQPRSRQGQGGAEEPGTPVIEALNTTHLATATRSFCSRRSCRKQQDAASLPSGAASWCASSGGICAFTVAWNILRRRKVFSTIGSFTNIRGGNAYPSLIRKTERKPLRVFLQDSSGDLDNPFGNCRSPTGRWIPRSGI